MPRRVFCFLAVALTYMLTMAIAVASAGREGGDTADRAPLAQQVPAADYVGTETCIVCHEEQQHGYENSPHGKAANPRSPAAARGCESCHGPGGHHLEDPSEDTALRKFAKMTARDLSATCVSCHTKSSHALWQGSAHDARNLSCVRDSPVFPTLVSLMYQWRPYTAHSGFARLMYRW